MDVICQISLSLDNVFERVMQYFPKVHIIPLHSSVTQPRVTYKTE